MATCQECADDYGEEHGSQLCLHCREIKIEQLKEEIEMLEN